MNIKIFDTTLRDGEQTPGVSLTFSEKLRIASKLDDIKVDYIEAGSAITSEGERNSIKEISQQGFNADILSFSRPLIKDINYCLDCDVDGVNLVVPTSDLHIFDKLNTSKEDLLEMSNNAIQYCKDHGLSVEISAEDGSRSDIDFIKTVFNNAADFKADRFCICDTVGILTPDKSFSLFYQFKDFSKPISCHCHNDFGLAVANTLSAIRAGACEFHSTINGIGERAGNTSFEETVVAIDRLIPNYSTSVDIQKIYSISKLVARLTGVNIQPNKAIVGENAFAHESGIYADGVIKRDAIAKMACVSPRTVDKYLKKGIESTRKKKLASVSSITNKLNKLSQFIEEIELEEYGKTDRNTIHCLGISHLRTQQHC